MSFGLAVYKNGKAYDVGTASPLTWIADIAQAQIPIDNTRTATFDYSAYCPDGCTLVVIMDRYYSEVYSSVTTTMAINRISVSVAGRVVTIRSGNRTLGAGTYYNNGPTYARVFAIYPNRRISSGFGIDVADGGTFPIIVNSSQGLFATYITTVTFTGQLALPISDTAMVFCNWDNAGISIKYDRSTRTLTGYSGNNQVGGFSIVLRIVAFEMKTPTMPAWGFAIYGADGAVCFTSEEVPMVVREWVSIPNSTGTAAGFASPGNGPMIQVGSWGAILRNNIYYVSNTAMNNSALYMGTGAQIRTTSAGFSDYDEIGGAGSRFPVLYATDYF